MTFTEMLTCLNFAINIGTVYVILCVLINIHKDQDHDLKKRNKINYDKFLLFLVFFVFLCFVGYLIFIVFSEV